MDILSGMCVVVLRTQLFCGQLKFQQWQFLDVQFHAEADRPSDCKVLRLEQEAQYQLSVASFH